VEENIESAKHIILDLAAYFFKHNVAQVTNDATNFLAYCFRVLEKTGDYIWNKKIELTKDKHGSIESDMEIRHYIYKYVQKGFIHYIDTDEIPGFFQWRKFRIQ